MIISRRGSVSVSRCEPMNVAFVPTVLGSSWIPRRRSLPNKIHMRRLSWSSQHQPCASHGARSSWPRLTANARFRTVILGRCTIVRFRQPMVIVFTCAVTSRMCITPAGATWPPLLAVSMTRNGCRLNIMCLIFACFENLSDLEVSACAIAIGYFVPS